MNIYYRHPQQHTNIIMLNIIFLIHLCYFKSDNIHYCVPSGYGDHVEYFLLWRFF